MSNKKEEMLSLYEYLGHASGPELGKLIADYASIVKAKYSTKHIPWSKHRGGKIMIYEKEFIDQFFKVKKLFSQPDYTEINAALNEDSFKQEENNLVF